MGAIFAAAELLVINSAVFASNSSSKPVEVAAVLN